MGKQLIILGCVGSFNPQLTAELVKFLSERGLEIQHASNRYEGQTHFAVGTGADLAAAFESAEIKTAFVEVTATTAEPAEVPISLQTILDAVNKGREEVQAFFKYEKPADKKKGKPEAEKKKGPPAADEKPADEKPADEKPADEKPADEKPAEETQPPDGSDVQA